MKAGQIMQTLVPQARYAGEMVIGSDLSKVGSETGKRYLYASGGRVYLYMNGAATDLFTGDFYDGCTVELDTKKIENNLMEITLAVALENGEARSELMTSVRVLNTQDIGGTEGAVLSYTWNDVPVSTGS